MTELDPTVALLILALSLVPSVLAIRWERSGLVRPLTFFVIATIVYYVIPLALWIARGTAGGSSGPVQLVALGNVALASTYVAAMRPSRRASAAALALARRWLSSGVARVRSGPAGMAAVFTLVAVVSAVTFIASVGGIGAYLCSLDRTGITTAGKTYLLWGMLLPKSAFLCMIGLPALRSQRLALALLGCASLLLVLLTGTRLFLLIGLIELALVIHIAIRPLRTLELFVFLCALLGIAVIYGEYRIESTSTPCAGVSLPTPTAVPVSPSPDGPVAVAPSPPPTTPTLSFLERLAAKMTDLDYVENRYTKNFVDALYVFDRVYMLVPAKSDYLHGYTYVQLLLQPLPRVIRPQIAPLPPALAAEFTGVGTGNVFQYWAEAYLNFGGLGVFIAGVVAGTLLAVGVGICDSLGDRNKRAVLIAVLVASMLLLYRGSFVGAAAFSLMDLIPVLLFLVVTRSGQADRSEGPSLAAQPVRSPRPL